MKNDKLLKLLDDLHIVNASLNSMSVDAVKARMLLLREKFGIQAQLNLYSDNEIREARGQPEEEKPKYIEEEEVKKVYERGSLYYLLLMWILTSDSKNKAFLLIALELFCKDERLIKTQTIRKI